jgi:hypothetical protein
MQEGSVSQAAIFIPFFGMMLLTVSVWLYMYARRLRFLSGNNVNPQRVATPARAAQVIPERVNYPSDNLKNLFELPVLFYAVCLYLYVTEQVDPFYLACAWTFLALRVVHSAIQCTINLVPARFAAYMLAALALWLMIGRGAWQLLAA